MAQSPYSGVPTVTPNGPGGNLRQNISSSPADFGGLEGAATQKLGGDLGSLGANLTHSAVEIQDRYNQVSVQDAYNKLEKSYFDLTYDPAKGIYAKQGADALNAYPATKEALETTRQSVLDSLPNDAQKLAFESAARRLQYLTMSTIGRHVDSQFKTWGTTTEMNGASNANALAAANPGDPGNVASATEKARMNYFRAAQIKLGDALGTTPETQTINREAALRAADTSTVTSVVDGLLRQQNPAGALKFLKDGYLPPRAGSNDPPQGVPVMQAIDPTHHQALYEKVQNMGYQAIGDQAGRGAVQRVLNGGGGVYRPGTPFTPANLPAGISPDEDAMVRTISGEAGKESLSGQQAVAAVILNRAKGAGVSPRDVVFAPNQFEPWNGGSARARLESMSPSSPEYQAILKNVVRPMVSGSAQDPTGGATHFYAPKAQVDLGRAAPSWAQGTPTVIGGHNFYKLGYGRGAAGGSSDLPTTNDARGPLTGDQIQQIYDDLDQNPALVDPKARNAARVAAERQIAVHDKAVHADQQAMMNDWGTKILADPTSVKESDILNDPRGQWAQKHDMVTELRRNLKGESGGLGDKFNDLFGRTNAGSDDPDRIQSPAQIYPYLGHGLTFAGVKALEGHIMGRSSVDGETLRMSQQSVTKVAEQLINPKINGKSISLTGAEDYERFLGAAYQKAAELMKSGKVSPLEIWGSGGPIAKLAEEYASPIALKQREVNRGASGWNGAAAPGAPVAAAPGGGTPAPRAPTLVVGTWYKAEGGALKEVPENTPGARKLIAPNAGSAASWGPKFGATERPSAPSAP